MYISRLHLQLQLHYPSQGSKRRRVFPHSSLRFPSTLLWLEHEGAAPCPGHFAEYFCRLGVSPAVVLKIVSYRDAGDSLSLARCVCSVHGGDSVSVSAADLLVPSPSLSLFDLL